MLESINEIKDGESVSNAQAEKYNFKKTAKNKSHILQDKLK